MGIVTSVFGSVIGLFLPDRPYWAVKLRHTGKWLCELDMRNDVRLGMRRPFDWTLDMVDTGDVCRIEQLWLFCPPSKQFPMGQSDYLVIPESGTAFQLKVGILHAFGESSRVLASQLIGRVENKETGECSCLVWDVSLGVLGTWTSNIYEMGKWRDGMAPLGNLSQHVLGIQLA